jgi:two-component system, NtrC family, sensor kinase
MTADAAYSAEVSAYSRAHPLAPGMDSHVGRTALTGKVVQIPDVLADPDYKAFEYQRVARCRAEIKLTI